MISIASLATQQGELFLLMLAGLIFRKRLVGNNAKKDLTTIVLNLILPCNIIASFMTEFDPLLFRQSFSILLISFVNQFFCLVLAKVLYRNRLPEKQAVMRYGTLCPNSGFLGTPIAEGIWGSEGILLTSVFLIPQRIFMWTAGVSFFKKTKFKWKTIISNPCIDAVVIGMLLFTFQLPLPDFLEHAICSFGKCNTGMSMFLIGMIIAEANRKELFNRDIFVLSFIRLVLIPAIVLFGCSLMRVDPLCSGVSAILSAMPVAGTTAVLASKYGGDAPFAACSIAVSTLLSMLAIPLWGLLLK